MEFALISEVTTWDSGGGIEMDIVTLKDGRVLGITEDSVVLYESMEDMEAGEAKERPMIVLA